LLVLLSGAVIFVLFSLLTRFLFVSKKKNKKLKLKWQLLVAATSAAFDSEYGWVPVVKATCAYRAKF
jgi:hypothetical protein